MYPMIRSRALAASMRLYHTTGRVTLTPRDVQSPGLATAHGTTWCWI
jgi:hypothetical protein